MTIKKYVQINLSVNFERKQKKLFFQSVKWFMTQHYNSTKKKNAGLHGN